MSSEWCMRLIISRKASLLKGRESHDRNIFQKEQMKTSWWVLLCERKQEFGVFIWMVGWSISIESTVYHFCNLFCIWAWISATIWGLWEAKGEINRKVKKSFGGSSSRSFTPQSPHALKPPTWKDSIRWWRKQIKRLFLNLKPNISIEDTFKSLLSSFIH